MKKISFLLIAVLSIGALQAQTKDRDEQPKKITIIGGLNLSKYVGGEDNLSKTNYKPGLILGVNKDVKITPLIWANGGLLYYQNGASTELGDYKFDYLMVPTGLKLNFGPVYAMGGFYGAYRLTAKLDDVKLDNKDFNRLDFGTYACVGLKFLLLSFNVKYNWGISDVSNGSNNNTAYDLRNRFVSFTLGIGIP